MPRTVHPDLPDDLDRAIDAFGNRIRVAIIRSLIADGPATRREIGERIAVGSPSLQQHLAKLEDLGIAGVHPPRSEGDVRRRLYSIVPGSVEKHLAALKRALG